MARKQRGWGLAVLCLGVLCLFGVSPAEIAYAASPEGAMTEIMGGLSGGGGGFGSTFTNQLGGLSKSLLTAAKLIAVIMTAAAGCMVCFGIQDSRTAFWNWILGIGLAINFGDLLLNLWGVETVSAPPKIASYDLLLKSESDPSIDILSPFMRYYIGVIMQGAAAVVPYAINLTLLLALIDGSIRLAFDLVGGDKVKFLVTTVLKVGFFIFLIHSWVGTNSNYQLMPALSSGFETMGYTAGGAQDMITEYVKGNPDSNIEVQSNQIVTNALNFFNIFWESASQKNLLTILVGLVCVVAAVIILFLTALEMFMVRIEFWTMALITIPLLPFGVIDKLKFLSDKAICRSHLQRDVQNSQRLGFGIEKRALAAILLLCGHSDRLFLRRGHSDYAGLSGVLYGDGVQLRDVLPFRPAPDEEIRRQWHQRHFRRIYQAHVLLHVFPDAPDGAVQYGGG